jgi:hypothetical protein
MVSRSTSRKEPHYLVGRKEKVSFPDFELFDVVAKIDTGAYRSSLHGKVLSVRKESDGREWVTFEPLGKKQFLRPRRQIKLPLLFWKDVKSSNGSIARRPFVELMLQIGALQVKGEFGITDRSVMKCTVLLGRKILKGKFLVDVSKVNLGGKVLPTLNYPYTR